MSDLPRRRLPLLHHLITSDRAYECTASDSLITGTVNCSRDRTGLVTEAEADRFSNPRLIPAGTAYKCTYEGVYSAHLVPSWRTSARWGSGRLCRLLPFTPGRSSAW